MLQQRTKAPIPHVLERISTLQQLLDWSQRLTCPQCTVRLLPFKPHCSWTINSIKRSLKPPNEFSFPLTLASYTYYYHPSLKRIFQIFDNNPILQYLRFQTQHLCPFEQLLALLSLAMSRSSSPIFVPSRSSSPANSAGNTPYIVTSPPSESIASATLSECCWPNDQMV